MIAKVTSRLTLLLVLAGCLAACASSGMSSRAAGAGYCPAGSIKVCTSLFEPEKERFPSCACSELITSR